MKSPVATTIIAAITLGAASVALSTAASAASEPNLDVRLMVKNQALDNAQNAPRSACNAFKVGLKDKNSRLNLRSGPGTQHKVIGQFPFDGEMRVIDSRGDWVGIVYGTDNARESAFTKQMRGLCQDGYEGPYQWTGSEAGAGWVNQQYLLPLYKD